MNNSDNTDESLGLTLQELQMQDAPWNHLWPMQTNSLKLYKLKLANWEKYSDMGDTLECFGASAVGIILLICFIANIIMFGFSDGDVGALLMILFCPLIPFAMYSLPVLVKRKCIREYQEAEREYQAYLSEIRRKNVSSVLGRKDASPKKAKTLN